jgi:integrase
MVSMSPAWVESVQPLSKPVEYRDEDTSGLLLRVEPTGHKAWYVRYSFHGEGRRFKLGVFPETTLAKARKNAEKTRGAAHDGVDRQAERTAQIANARLGETVAEAVRSWLESESAEEWRPRSRQTFLSHINLRILPRLGKLRPDEVTQQHVQKMLDTLRDGGKATRNRCLTVTRMFFRWLIRNGRLLVDPTKNIEKLHEGGGRRRVLTDDEIRAFVKGFDGTRYGIYMRLLFLTAARRDELLAARWRDVDLDMRVWTIPPEFEKTGKERDPAEPRRIALCNEAVRLLKLQKEDLDGRGLGKSPWIFSTSTGNRPHRDAVKPVLNTLRGLRPNGTVSTDKRAKKRVAVLPLDANPHDIRRTVSDRLVNTYKVGPWVIDVGILGHSKPKLLGVYAPGAPVDESREALEMWSLEFAGILSAGKAKEG